MNKNTRVIKLTRIKQYYYPVDSDSYKILRSVGLPMTRIHVNFMPTVQMITRPQHIRGIEVDFKNEIFNPFLDKLGTVWNSKKWRKSTLTSSVLKFESSDQLKESKVGIDKLEAVLRRFFSRWGFTSVFEYSEVRGKCKLHVVYKFDVNKQPLVPLSEDVTSLPAVQWVIGFVRLTLTMGERHVETQFALKAADNWTNLYTSKCLYSEVADVRPMLATLMTIPDICTDNFDKPNSNIK